MEECRTAGGQKGDEEVQKRRRADCRTSEVQDWIARLKECRTTGDRGVQQCRSADCRTAGVQKGDEGVQNCRRSRSAAVQ